MGTYDEKHMWHFACFECRVTFKTHQEKLKCPNCKKEMNWMSVTFRAPKKTDKKAWLNIKKEYNKGNKFCSKWWAR